MANHAVCRRVFSERRNRLESENKPYETFIFHRPKLLLIHDELNADLDFDEPPCLP